MKVREGQTESKDDHINNFDHTIKNIIAAAYALRKIPGFTKAFDAIRAGSNPEAWTPNDAIRIMRSYQLIFETLSQKRAHHSIPGWKIPGYAKCAAWFYEHMTDHRYASTEYYLAACSVYLHHPIFKLSNITPREANRDTHLPRYVQAADQAAAIATHVEANLYYPTIDDDNLHRNLTSLAIIYRDISLIYQVAADYDKALYYYESACRTLNAIPTQNTNAINILSEMYHDLSVTFSFNTFYHQLFRLMEDFFMGNLDATYSRLAQLDFNYRQSSTVQLPYENLYAQCLLMIDRYAYAAPLPVSTLKQQLQNDFFYGKLNGLLQAYQLDPLQPSPTASPIKPSGETSVQLAEPVPHSLTRQPTFFANPATTNITDDPAPTLATVTDSDDELFIPTQQYTPSPTPH